MKLIDKLLAEGKKQYIRNKRERYNDRYKNMTNEELDAEITRLTKLLGVPRDISFDEILRRRNEVWESMTDSERNEYYETYR